MDWPSDPTSRLPELVDSRRAGLSGRDTAGGSCWLREDKQVWSAELLGRR